MTSNQLRYWELRWKQYYEYYSLQETKRSNKAKEAETHRHNVAEERLRKQELVLRSIELAQNQEKINQKWAELSFNDRKLFIETTLEYYKMAATARSLDQRDKEIQLRSQEIANSAKLAIADLVVQYNDKKTKQQLDTFDSYVKALEKGWDKAAAAEALTAITSDNQDDEQLTSLINDIAKQYHLELEVKGPSLFGNKISNAEKGAKSLMGAVDDAIQGKGVIDYRGEDDVIPYGPLRGQKIPKSTPSQTSVILPRDEARIDVNLAKGIIDAVSQPTAPPDSVTKATQSSVIISPSVRNR